MDSDEECDSIYEYGSDDLEYNSESEVEHNNNDPVVPVPINGENQSNGVEGRIFNRVYFCYPVSYTGKTHLENGNLIIMPSSALDSLLDMEVNHPMMFEIENKVFGRRSHCGVSEFTAEEGRVFLPNWLMQCMELKDGDTIDIRSRNLPHGTYLKLQPHSMDFLALPDPKYVLEECLSNKFFCLTTGETIKINYNSKDFYFNVIETKPPFAISIINTDCELDLACPFDYKEPEKPAVKQEKVVAFFFFLLGGSCGALVCNRGNHVRINL
ncbi:hypothetical protein JCGZ_25568 [Jatropha curcas]|uniref:Uncharacterized protein n=1 Tax=Jatropha curcas TaxID=180498 RepID=A0A067JL66_JATCU|nr:hypothetical protein JCGZ_25568 [Jatropha curcas]